MGLLVSRVGRSIVALMIAKFNHKLFKCVLFCAMQSINTIVGNAAICSKGSIPLSMIIFL